MSDGKKAGGAVIAAAAVGIGGAVTHDPGLFGSNLSHDLSGAAVGIGGAVTHEPGLLGSNLSHDLSGLSGSKMGTKFGSNFHPGTMGEGQPQILATVTEKQAQMIIERDLSASAQAIAGKKELDGMLSKTQNFAAGAWNDSNQSQQSRFLNKVTDLAKPQILGDLEQYRMTLTEKQAQMIIERDLSASAQAIAEKKDSGIKFEALNGKLKIDSSFRIAGAQISGGEINVYKVAGVAAVGLAACKGMDVAHFQACVSAALAKVGFEIAEIKDKEPEPKTVTETR